MSFNTEKYINVEGVVLPNEPLSNFQLIDAAKKLKIKHFRGVYVRDELPKSPKKGRVWNSKSMRLARKWYTLDCMDQKRS